MKGNCVGGSRRTERTANMRFMIGIEHVDPDLLDWSDDCNHRGHRLLYGRKAHAPGFAVMRPGQPCRFMRFPFGGHLESRHKLIPALTESGDG